VSVAQIQLDDVEGGANLTVTVASAQGQQSDCNNLYLYSGLFPGTPHFVRVRGSNGQFWSEWSEVATLYTEATIPPAPGSITASQASADAFVEVGALPYTGGVDLAAIELEQLSSEPGDAWAMVASNDCADPACALTADRQFTVPLPREDLSYTFRARARNADDVRGEYSGEVNLITSYLAELPATPTDVQPTLPNASALASVPEGEGAVVIGWTQPNSSTPISSYSLQATPVESGGEPLPNSTAPVYVAVPSSAVSPNPCVSECSALVTSELLRPGVKYSLLFFSVGPAGKQSLVGDPVEITLPDTPPDAPSALGMLAATTSALLFSWQAPADNGEPLLGYVLDLGDGAPHAVAADGSALALPAAASCAAINATLGGTGVARTPAGSALNFTAGGLAAGGEYPASLVACNALGGGPAACLCASAAACEEPCALPEAYPATPTLPITLGVPATPEPPILTSDSALEENQTHTLYVQWATPDTKNRPPTAMQLQVIDTSDANGTRVYYFNTTEPAATVSGLQPATPYRAFVRVRNEVGWSAWSLGAWLWTLPTEPDAPTPPLCNPAAATESTLSVVILEPLRSNGLPPLQYEMNVSATSGLLLAEYVTGPSATDRQVTVGSVGLVPTTAYVLHSRTKNDLGWSAWSEAAPTDQCTTGAPLGAGSGAQSAGGGGGAFDPIPVVGAAFAILLIGVISTLVYRNRAMMKVFAPKLRKKKAEKRMSVTDYLDDDADNAPEEEDKDADMIVNPVMMYRMQREKELARKNPTGKGGGGYKGPQRAGLTRLKLGFVDEGKEQERIAGSKRTQVLSYLAKAGDINIEEQAGGKLSKAKSTKSQKDPSAARAAMRNLKKAREQMDQEAGKGSMAAGLTRFARGAAARPRDDDEYDDDDDTAAGMTRVQAPGSSPTSRAGTPRDAGSPRKKPGAGGFEQPETDHSAYL
jgi:hypothetical protein